MVLVMTYLINPTLPNAQIAGINSPEDICKHRYLQELFKQLPDNAKALLNTSCTFETYTSIFLTLAESLEKGKATEELASRLNDFYRKNANEPLNQAILNSIPKEKLTVVLERIDKLLPAENVSATS